MTHWPLKSASDTGVPSWSGRVNSGALVPASSWGMVFLTTMGEWGRKSAFACQRVVLFEATDACNCGEVAATDEPPYRGGRLDVSHDARKRMHNFAIHGSRRP